MEDKLVVFNGGYNDLTNKLNLSGVHDDMSVYFYLTKNNTMSIGSSRITKPRTITS